MTRPPAIALWIVTPHAERQMRRRGINREMLSTVLTQPSQRFEQRPGREVLQRVVKRADGAADMLLRVFVDTDRIPAEVVTAYRTRKIEKYWRRAT